MNGKDYIFIKITLPCLEVTAFQLKVWITMFLNDYDFISKVRKSG